MKLLATLLLCISLCLSGCDSVDSPSSTSQPEKSESSKMSEIQKNEQEETLPNDSENVISNSEDFQLDKNNLSNNAKILTEHLACTLFQNENIKKGIYPPPDDREITRFIIGTVLYIENEDYLYHDVVSIDDEGYYHFPGDKIKSMVQEVLGIEEWLPNRPESGLNYNETNNDFSIMSGFGTGNNLECQNMDIIIDGDDLKVYVTYDLYTSSLFPDSKKIASVKTEFMICFKEDKSPFLRYLGTTN